MLLNTTNNDLSIVASGTGKVVLNGTSVDIGATKFQSSVKRRFAGVDIEQPVFQSGIINTSGTSGNQLVTIPVPYTAVSTYNVQISLNDTGTAQISYENETDDTFRIYWTSASAGGHNIVWLSYGV
jgi:hypothetical protein